MEKAKANNVKIVFPVDSIIADKFNKDANVSLMASVPQITLLINSQRFPHYYQDLNCIRRVRDPRRLARS
jgi:hypothetical protein